VALLLLLACTMASAQNALNEGGNNNNASSNSLTTANDNATAVNLTCAENAGALTCSSVVLPPVAACAKHNNSGVLKLDEFKILAPCTPNGTEAELDESVGFGIVLGDDVNGSSNPNNWTNATDRIACMEAIQQQVNDWIVATVEKVFTFADAKCSANATTGGTNRRLLMKQATMRGLRAKRQLGETVPTGVAGNHRDTRGSGSSCYSGQRETATPANSGLSSTTQSAPQDFAKGGHTLTGKNDPAGEEAFRYRGCSQTITGINKETPAELYPYGRAPDGGAEGAPLLMQRNNTCVMTFDAVAKIMESNCTSTCFPWASSNCTATNHSSANGTLPEQRTGGGGAGAKSEPTPAPAPAPTPEPTQRSESGKGKKRREERKDFTAA